MEIIFCYCTLLYCYFVIKCYGCTRRFITKLSNILLVARWRFIAMFWLVILFLGIYIIFRYFDFIKILENGTK